MEENESGDDHETMMDSCAVECMNAIESKDKEAFKSAFEVLLSDLLNKMSTGDEE